MVTKNIIQSLIWYLDQLDVHRFILDTIQIDLVKKALEIFGKLYTNGYECQFMRLKEYIFSNYFSTWFDYDNKKYTMIGLSNPLLSHVYLYDDEIKIIIMGLEKLKEEATE